jgi:regulatory protein
MSVTANRGRTLALRWLARRPLTETEIRGRLAGKDVDDVEIERIVCGLIDERLIDDAILATDFIVLRSRRMHQGKSRLLRDLKRRGVDGEIAERAYREAVDQGEVVPEDLLREALERRIRREPERTDRARHRVYNALFRAGFSAAELYAELSRQWPNDTAGHGYQDDEGP